MIILGNIYIFSIVICLYIAYHIFKDEWENYIAGGAAETILMIIIAFLPILNTLYAILIGGEYLLKKLKNNDNNT
jgi:hypothetical protein